MSYDTVLKFHIDRKNLTISGRYRSSNAFDANNRRVVEDYTKKYDNIDAFMNAVFDYADDALNGSLRFSPSSTMNKRLSWLKQHHKLQYAYPEKAQSDDPEDAWYRNWYCVARDLPTYRVLTGEVAVSPTVYVVSNGTNFGVKVTTYQIKLTSSHWTRFYDRDAANRLLRNCKEWRTRYHLQVNQLA